MSGVKLDSESLKQIIARSLHVIVQANRLPDGQRKIVSITEVLDADGSEIHINEVFKYQRQGMDDQGKMIGDHTYVSESMMMERFYQSGALPRS